MDEHLKNEQLEVIKLPTIHGFLEFLQAHAGPGAPLGQWGCFPEARGQILAAAEATGVPGAEKWLGMPVTDANGLAEIYVGQRLEGDAPARMRHQYQEWCYGHIGDDIEDMVQLPGGAVFQAGLDGEFIDVGYLYRKTGPGPLDWDIFVCNDMEQGLCVQPLDERWTHWGLISMVMRYNVPGPMTADLPPLPAGVPYGVVWSSVLNFRAKEDRHLVTSLPNGTVVQLTGGTDGDWTECLVGNRIGYVFTRFLVKHGI